MTKRLYYDQSNLKEFNAHIVETQETEQGVSVRLDRTAFYPTSGGQPYDTGTLAGHPVLDVWEDEQGTVWHQLELPSDMPALPKGKVVGKINWQRRFDHTQQHTGQHLLSAGFVEVLEAPTIGFHLGSESSTIDLDIPNLNWEAAFRVEAAVNHVIWEDRPVTTRFVTQDELEQLPLRKPPQVSDHIRVVFIEGFDASACGGTHVTRTGAIGLVKITGIARYKGGTRVSFLCGKRAMRDYRRALYILQHVSTDMTVGPDELRDAVQRLQDEVKTANRALHKTQSQLWELEAERMWNQASHRGGIHWIMAHWTPEEAEEAYRAGHSFEAARAVASYLRERPRTLILLATTEEKGLRAVCARSDDLKEINAAEILRDALSELGGRGGGSAVMAQGGGPSAPHEAVVASLTTALERAAGEVASEVASEVADKVGHAHKSD
jgi:alanyl-tRNA synthetase